MPELGLLVAVPFAFTVEDDWYEDRPRKPLSSLDRDVADTLPIALAVGALAVGGKRWMDGDDGRTFEATAEALTLTAAATELLKKTVGKHRPDSKSTSSFPSGHTSFSFAATTLLIRQLGDENDESWSPWEILAYAPAGFVAAERVRANRHWTSDVVVGAFLGTFLSNWVWDAHFGDAKGDRRAIYQPERKLSWRLSSDVIEGKPVFGVTIAF